jgi:hypothetical protein
LEYFAANRHKHARAKELRPADALFEGVYAIFVAKAPALVWQVRENAQGKPVIRRPKDWPLINHYHFHIIDREWGHISIKLSGHAPFGANISLNGHEWVQRQAQRRGIAWQRQANCFADGSDYAGIEKIAAQLDGPRASRAWRRCANAGFTAPACALDSRAKSSAKAASITVSRAARLNTAATCSSNAAARSTRVAKGCLNARAKTSTCP